MQGQKKHKRIPRGFFGALFYVFGWLFAAIVIALWTVARFLVTAVYRACKRGQFYRHLSRARNKAESDRDGRTRELGREELRFLAASLGLDDADWHKTVRVRSALAECIRLAKEIALDAGDFNQVAADGWERDLNRFLFLNFDRNLLTGEKSNKRFYRIPKFRVLSDSAEQPAEKDFAAKLHDVLSKRNDDEVENRQSENSAESRDDSTGFKLNDENISLINSTEWSQDDERRELEMEH